MIGWFRRRRPQHRAESRPPIGEVLVMSAWGLDEDQWRALTEPERAERRLNITSAPRFKAVS